MAMVGLAITFYVPRRRLWVKVTPARTYMAGVAEKTTRLGREMRLMEHLSATSRSSSTQTAARWSKCAN